jgi:hypothetical protein
MTLKRKDEDMYWDRQVLPDYSGIMSLAFITLLALSPFLLIFGLYFAIDSSTSTRDSLNFNWSISIPSFFSEIFYADNRGFDRDGFRYCVYQYSEKPWEFVESFSSTQNEQIESTVLDREFFIFFY